MPSIDEYSVATVPIELMFNSTKLGLGTAFVWDNAGQYFLITNWHNLSGKDVFSKKYVAPTAAEPTHIVVWWNQKGQLGAKFSEVIPVRDNQDMPLWWIHPQHGSNIDVVALPVVSHPNAEMYPINKMSQTHLLLQVGMDVYVLGYPLGIGAAGLPIWKRGSIASEPEIFPHGQMHFLIDTASRPGMSGSPVIRRSWGTHQMKDGGISMGAGTATEFIGVYSGRYVTSDPLDAQLGIAWPASLVQEIVMGSKRDQ